MTFDRDASGKVKIEDKKQIKKRLGNSPDFADAVMLGVCRNHLLNSGNLLEDMVESGKIKDIRIVNKKRNRWKELDDDDFSVGTWMGI